MIGKKLVSRKKIPLFEVKDLIKDRAGAKELSYEQNLALTYAKKFSNISPAKGKKLLEDLEKIEGMTERLAVNIVDILPNSEEKLNLLVSPEDKVSKENLDKILELVKKNIK